LIILDTGALLAALDEAEPTHEAAHAALAAEPGPFVLSPLILEELDYLLVRELGRQFALAFAREVAAGAYDLATISTADVATAAMVIEQYLDLGIGLADASIVVLAAKCGTKRILTLDERHFRAMRPLEGGHFTLLPADA
jgi:predicted nucleic acid-binding protein